MSRREAKKRYVVLPGSGISGAAMETSLFQEGHGRILAAAASRQLQRFGLMGANSVVTAARAGAELDETIAEDEFEVISQRFADGPAVVRMTDAAKLALSASNPDLRIVPVTRYSLPGLSSRGEAREAAIPTAVVASDVNGNVFTADAKQHFLGGLSLPPGHAGQGVNVGVLDTGVDNTHPALSRTVPLLRCFIPGENVNDGGPVDWGDTFRDRAGHGTHVAGVIAAEAGHGGPGGVAPEARVFSYRIFPGGRGAKSAENGTIIDSIRGAIEDGCHVINLSLEGTRLKDDGVRTAIADAWNQGVVCIAAAGNGFGSPVSYPAALPHCVAVTAIGRDGMFPPLDELQRLVGNQRSTVDPAVFLASFSNFGPKVQFTAPGHAIVSTFPGGEWWFNSGTSMAAPFVAGMLALLLSGRPDILAMPANAAKSTAMLQMLIAGAKLLGLPQRSHEGYGLPA